MGLFSILLRLTTSKANRVFVEQTKNPEAAQVASWQRIWNEIEGSKFWKNPSRTPDFDSRTSGNAPGLENFEITTYEDYRLAIENSLPTGVSELSGKPVIFWSESSGSSGKRKLFPITEAFKKEFQMVTPPQTQFLCRLFPKFLDKHFLFFVATKPTETSPSGVEIGFISHYNYKNIPKNVAKRYGFPIEVFKDSETFYEWGPLYAVAQDLSAIAAITPSMISQLGQRIADQMSRYWPYLEGRMTPPQPLPPLKVSRRRHARLKKYLGSIQPGETFSYKDIWPGLQFVTCWKSATCGLQLPTLNQWLNNQVPVVEGALCATEGWMTVPQQMSRLGTVVHPGSHIVEFLEVGQTIAKVNLLKIWQLEIGKSYEMFLTTSAGMIRYRLFDIVRCNGFFNRSPIIEFQGKSGNMVSIGQIRFTEENLFTAIQLAGGLGGDARWFFAPNQAGTSLVLFSDRAIADIERKLMVVDAHLKEINSEYAGDLNGGLMDPLSTLILPIAHPAWNAPIHAQTKPRILSARPPLEARL